ncbi:MAG: 30S ribosomal protein S4 [Bacteroidetes bacterium]|jgi:small subunit ribosomal protein S4|nr:30S ribosomal protein S4 [Bacteroidota bacterium]MCL5034010.1 30S ribosomal protein S4 [Bacteroidota bacterium]
MARYVDASCRLCRRERQKLFLKGVKCYTDKCPLERRNYAPGQHGLRRRVKVSEYGVQLREKQKVKRIYGVFEQQFRHYFEMATHQKGRTGENLLRLLERRLDNVLYRLGFAPSRKSARQLVLHGHFTVNSRRVDIASYLVKAGDVIRVAEGSNQLDVIHSSIKRVKDGMLPSYLQLDKAQLTGTFLQVPERSEIPLPDVNEQLIVELYSK